ncbi:MAG TPA: recombination protein O N-terminal domain-containing protein, partial [Phycisphaerae bacterium]|nr:recombination protein O N-terminal domain-containing protein [Phycisphaerae bacterium]
MPPVKDQAIVLRHLDYSETSQVLACLTREHGSRRFIAKGIKRATKNKAATIIDLLEQGEVVFLVRPQSESELSILTEWRQV